MKCDNEDFFYTQQLHMLFKIHLLIALDYVTNLKENEMLL